MSNRYHFEQQTIDVLGHQLMMYDSGMGDELVLLLHGGPGMCSDYLQDSHQFLVDSNYRVVTWDQLGGGRSDRPDDDSLWTMARFVDEVETLRQTLGHERVHLLGHSWGGILAVEYAMHYPQYINSLLLCNTTASMAPAIAGTQRLKQGLGQAVYTQMSQREQAGAYEAADYQVAVQKIYAQHMCRCKPWPDSLSTSMQLSGFAPGKIMYGPYPLNVSGTLKNWDRLGDLHQLEMPCLLIQGEHDIITPDCAELSHQALPNSELHILKGCSHHPCFEDAPAYQKLVLDFLDRDSA